MRKKIKEFLIQNSRRITCICIAMLMVLAVLSLRKSQTVLQSTAIAKTNNTLTEVKNNVSIQQSISMNLKESVSYTAIGVRVATYGKNLTKGQVVLSLVDEQENVLFSKPILASTIVDNQQIELPLEPILEVAKDEKRELILQIEAEGFKPTEKLVIWGGEKSESDEICVGKLWVGDEESDTTLNISLKSIQKERNISSLYYCICGTLILIATYLMLPKANMKETNHEKIN